MTELEKAARMALEALQHYTYGGSEYRKPAERAITELTQALATTEPVKPLFAAKVAAQKWAELQEQGHRMQTIWFDGGPGGAGTIDPWGKVTWSKTEPDVPETNFGNTTEPSNGFAWVPGHWAATERKGEPVAWLVSLPDEPELGEWFSEQDMGSQGYTSKPLYTSPQVPEDVQRDAERYRWLRAKENANRDEWNLFGPYSTPAQIDAAIDAARKGE